MARARWQPTAWLLAKMHNCAPGQREALTPDDCNPYARRRPPIVAEMSDLRPLFLSARRTKPCVTRS